MLWSRKRLWWSVAGAIILEFYAFNFVPRNVNIIATRTLSVKIFDYVFNFLIFFIAIYLLAFVVSFLGKIFSGKK